ncbi:hypothetical protein KP78_27490 [Jeotgalibacillus soli]|uniref:Uncharacterized protein n=1 Tax=Jeotgalibacillus soli TaxID=889306 RepID=A0A0C2R4L3_9BACL|nr:hypothetical protein KP78_27490 [Jeotgalibacillus soli]
MGSSIVKRVTLLKEQFINAWNNHNATRMAELLTEEEAK